MRPTLPAAALALALAACATTRTTTRSSADVIPRPGALACARERAAELGYSLRASADTAEVAGERAALGDRLVVRRVADGKLRIQVDGAPERATSDVRTIGQACGFLVIDPSILLPASQPPSGS